MGELLGLDALGVFLFFLVGVCWRFCNVFASCVYFSGFWVGDWRVSDVFFVGLPLVI